MKNCIKCGNSMEEDEIFCGVCGAGQEPPEQKPTKGIFCKRNIILVVAVAAVVVIGGVIVLFGMKPDSRLEQLIYSKDNTASQYSLKNKKSLELTNHASSSGSLLQIAASLIKVNYSKEKDLVFYMEMVDDTGEGTLMYQDLKQQGGKEKVPQKLDTEVKDYQLLSSGKVVYTSDRSNHLTLYLSDLKDKRKIGTDIMHYTVSSDQSCLIYLTNNHGLYTYDLTKKDASRENLASAVSYLGSSDDLNYIYYIKNDQLMCLKNRKDSETIASGLRGDLNFKYSLNKSSLYYLVPMYTYKITDYIEDEYAKIDVFSTEPDLDYYKVPNGTDGFGATTYTYDVDKYQADLDIYDKKLQRDSIRNRFNSIDDLTMNELYLYDGKTSIKIADSVADIVRNRRYAKSYADQAICVSQLDQSKLKKYSLSDFNAPKDVSAKLKDWQKGAEVYALVTGTVMSPFDTDAPITASSFDAKNHTFNYSTGVDRDAKTTLYSINYSQSSIQSPAKIADDVDYMELINNKLCYMTDVNDDAYSGIFWAGGNKIDEDVSVVFPLDTAEKDNSLYYAKNYNDEDSAFSLYLYRNGKSIKIADDVFCFKPYENGSIAYLQDYSLNQQKGDLYLWDNDQKQTRIDGDVSYLQGSLGAYGYSWFL